MSSTRPSRAEIRRRRGGVAVAALLLVGLAIVVLPRDHAAPGATPSVPISSSAPDGNAASVRPIPAWLAWMPGGFPEGFADEVAKESDLGTTVVVAGDTLWMQESHDGSGAVVDRPDPPYAIPLDAFSVDPGDYAPFLPDELRDEIVGALRDGDAVLGTSSANLRRLGVGGTLSIGDTDITVGAVAPDDVVGWSEILVNRQVGARLQITHDRYLLALGTDGLTMSTFAAQIRSLLPADTPLRTEKPGGARFVRVASGANPPVLMKQVFGEFAATPRADDPAYLNVDPAWYDAHIETRTVPILGQVTCNRVLFPALVGALQEVEDRGLGDLIHTYSGCYAARTVARSVTAPPSNHAYGAAIDIDAPTNAYGDTTPGMDPQIVDIFERWGFSWGGDFLIPDGMHFEYSSAPKA